MRPGEGHGRTRRLAHEQCAAWNVDGVPHLFGQEASVTSNRFERLSEMLGDMCAAGSKLVVGPFAR